MLVAVLSVGMQCFAPVAQGPTMRTMPSVKTQLPAYVAPAQAARCAEPAMVSTAGMLAAGPALYAIMSVNEYITHRWYQHEEFNRDHAFQRFCQHVAKVFRNRPLLKPDGRTNFIKIRGGGHVEHHAETYDDMTLKKDPRWRKTAAAASLDGDAYRGTAFTWMVTVLMTIQMLPLTLPVFRLLGKPHNSICDIRAM